LLDALAYSSVLAAAVAAALSIAASRALGAPHELHWALIAAGGTFIVYSLDRLRDLERDALTSPIRTRFVLKHRRGLAILVGVVALVLAPALLTAPPSVIALCAAVGGLGFFHRRLKEFAALKAAYVSTSWVAICVGIPWIASGREAAGLWATAILLPTLAANLIASNLRDGEAHALSLRSRSLGANLWIARAGTAIALAIAFLAPDGLESLAWIPFFEGLALMGFRPTERYGHLVVDGAFLVGALATCIALA
jgi:4-hydroxybenzoate polyprenyltransferase